MAKLKSIAEKLVKESNKLRLKHAAEFDARVSYCAIFCQSQGEYDAYCEEATRIGRLANDTPTGPVFVVPAIKTRMGPLRIVKVRKPDKTRHERGDADFALANYAAFKAQKLGRPGFKLIEREDFEMIELVDSKFNARAYFSNPPVEEHAGIKEALAST